MITWTVHLRARPGKGDEWIALANELTESSHRLDAGCVVYLMVQHRHDPLEFTWYEQWADMETLQAHVQRINPLLGGTPRPGETYPPRLEDVIERRQQRAWQEFQESDPAPRDWRSPGITILFYITAKPGHADALAALVPELTRHSQADDGCVTYIIHRSEDTPDQFMGFEQWRDRAALDAHFASLIERFGPPGDDSFGLPAVLSQHTASMEGVPGRVVA